MTKPAAGQEWILVGSSPGATMFPRIREQYSDAVTITTNMGYTLFGEKPPDVYFFCDLLDLIPERMDTDDSRGSRRFFESRDASKQLKEQGCHVIGHIRNNEIRLQWGLEWFNEMIIAEVGGWRPWKFIPGKYTAARLSGLFCLQYAINNGATHVHLVGCEGYAASGHHFDTDVDSAEAIEENLTADFIGPFTQAVVKACPKVEFTFYGNLEYAIHGDNVEKVFAFPTAEAIVAEDTPRLHP